MLKTLTDNWRSYVWVPSGEIIRGTEIAFLTAFLTVLTSADIEKAADIKVWLFAAAIAGSMAALEFLKGKVPAVQQAKLSEAGKTLSKSRSKGGSGS